MDKVVVSNSEIAQIGDIPDQTTTHLEAKLPRPIPTWARIVLSLLVVALPVLCLFAAIMRLALRNQPPRTKHAWTAFFATLLTISGFLTSAALVVVLSFAPAPFIGGSGLADLDERLLYPGLPTPNVLSGTEVSQELKPLVVVVSPTARLWFGKQDLPSNSFGAGALLETDSDGYLFVTAKHVVGDSASRAMLSTMAGSWSPADVVGRHKFLDLALIWLPRHSGSANFIQPISKAPDGAKIFVIGHPQGLRYTLTNGIISRQQDSIIQISAPVSPGNSGGPVYDEHGNLIGIVSSTMDKSITPNAENLSFAVYAESLQASAGWNLTSTGKVHFDRFHDSKSTRTQ